MQYEYGVWSRRGGADNPWRTGMTESDARDWVAEFIADGGNPDAFFVIRRELGPWDRIEDAD